MNVLKNIKVLYIHGRNSSSLADKCRFLGGHFNVHAVDMPTMDFEADVSLQEETVQTFKPDVVIGSSYGGAIAVTMLQKGTWIGPTLLLAQAFAMFAQNDSAKLWLPKNIPITFIHGTKDAVVDIKGSQILAAKGDPELVKLIEVDDEHRLQTLVGNQLYVDAVKELYDKWKGPQAEADKEESDDK